MLRKGLLYLAFSLLSVRRRKIMDLRKNRKRMAKNQNSRVLNPVFKALGQIFLFTVLQFKTVRRFVCKRTVRSLGIIEKHIIFYALPELTLRPIVHPIQLFFLERRKECLGYRIVMRLA